MPVDLIGFAYAAAVAAGGVLGYYRAGSVPSLGAGVVFGGALAWGALQVSQDPARYATQLAASSVLAGVMAYRYYSTGRIMPAGVVCALSLVMVARIALKAAGVIEPHSKAQP